MARVHAYGMTRVHTYSYTVLSMYITSMNVTCLIRCVDDRIVRRQGRQLVAPVEVDAVDVEEEPVLGSI
jgi:hypothetical protein